MQQVNLEPQQILKAAQAGIQLLQTPGAVNVPGPLAISGDVAVLHAMLGAIVRQEVMIVNKPPQVPALEPEGANDGGGEPQE